MSRKLSTIKDRFERFAKKEKTSFSHDRSKTIGASEIGQCARKIGYSKSGRPADEGYPESAGFTHRGNVIEDAFSVPFMRAVVAEYGGELLWAGQSEQVSIVKKSWHMSATPDGLAAGVADDFLHEFGVEKCGPNVLVEFKSADPRLRADRLPKEEHVHQVNQGLGLVRDAWSKLGVSGPAPAEGLIVYVNASDFADIRGFVVNFDQSFFDMQKERARQILKTDPEVLRPEGKLVGGCRYCQYSFTCTGYTMWVPRETQKLPPKVAKDVLKRSSRVVELKAQRANLEAELSLEMAGVKEVLAAHRTKYAHLGPIRLNWTTGDGQDRKDAKAMEAELKRLGAWDEKKFIKKTKPSETLTIEKVEE